MPLIAVDIGNTSIKFGLFADGDSAPLPEPSSVTQVDTQQPDYAKLQAWLPAGEFQVAIASVHREAARLLVEFFAAKYPHASAKLLTFREMPLRVDVEAPDRVGLDRLAAAVAVNTLRDPRRTAIAIDAGTAITVDAVGVDGAFRGGAIVPGVAMMSRALHQNTDQLPQVGLDCDSPPLAIGRSTIAAIRSGLFWSAVGSLRELIARIGAELQANGTPATPQLFVSGGDSQALVRHLGSDAVLVSNLALRGIAVAARGVFSAGSIHP